MKRFSCAIRHCRCRLLLQIATMTDPNNGVHTTWLWHLHQPIYWFDRRNCGAQVNHSGAFMENVRSLAADGNTQRCYRVELLP